MPRRSSRARVLLGVLLSLLSLVLALAGCKFGGKEPDGEIILAGDSSEAPLTLTAASLNPILQAVGMKDAIPEKVVAVFGIGVIDQEKLSEDLSKDTVLTIEPEVDGQLSWQGLSTLVFTPEDGFAPDTEYKVTLASIDTKSGVIKPTIDGAWTYTFTTPSFRVLRVSPVSIGNRWNQRLDVDVVFTGNVTPYRLGEYATWTVNGVPGLQVTYEDGPTPNVVRAHIQHDPKELAVTIRLDVKAGMPSSGEGRAKAPAYFDEVKVDFAKAVTVHAVKRREGPSGHYFDVICSDASSTAGSRYFSDPDDYDWYELSSRCLLADDSAAESVHIDPPVPFYLTSSRSGFRIMGDFKRGSYTVTIDAGARSVDGGRVAGTWSSSYTVPARSPQVAFLSKGRYLPRTSWKNMAIRHVNLPTVDVTVRQIRPENVVFWLTADSETADQRTSDVLLKRNVALRGDPDVQATSWLDVSSLLPDKAQGVFEITLSGDGTKDSARLLLTDLNLVAKRAAVRPEEPWSRSIHVWALDMHSNRARTGVELKLVRPSGLVQSRCTTGTDGGCVLDVPVDDTDPAVPFAILAQAGDDFTYLEFEDLKTEVASTDVHGESFFSDKPYRTSSWTDRGVYRPGEVAHFASLVREGAGAAPPADLPVKVKLIDPQGTVARERVLKTNAAGLVSTDFSFAAYARTGRYQVSLETGEKTVGSYAFNVEEFVPERMKVTATAASPLGVASAAEAAVDVEARYLFGGSAAGSRVELSCQVEPASFAPKKNNQYTYGVWRSDREKTSALTLGSVTGELDEAGKARLSCPEPGEQAPFVGSGRIDADVAVFEAGSGRTTRGSANVWLHPEAWYLGLQSGSRKVEQGKPFTTEGIVVDWEGNPVTKVTEVEVELLRLDSESSWWWSEEEQEERYERFLRPISEAKFKVPVKDGKFLVNATPTVDSDGYLVRVKAGRAWTDLRLEGNGRSYWWEPSESRVDQTPRPLRPTSVEVTLPASVKVGEKATARFVSPYRGRALLTVETAEVVQAEWIDVEAGEQSWSFKLKEFAPNVYVSAFVVKDPYLDSKAAFLPDRAFGVASVQVVPTAFTHNVKLDVPDEVRSNSTLTVKLDLGPVPAGTVATVAAVDEGILSLTGFQSPNPLADVFARRALGVESFETVGWTFLLPPMGPTSSAGGDEGGGGAGRVQPVKPVALWSGVVDVPESGKVTVDFAVPQYRGSLRVMAVTADPKRMGSAVANVTVRDPIVLQTTLPRFLTQGDEAEIPVFVTNMSGRDQEIYVGVAAENLPTPGLDPAREPPKPISFVGKDSTRVKLANGASRTVVFRIVGNAAVGAAKLRVVARAGELESREELDVPFAPTGTRIRKLQRIPLSQTETDLTSLLQGWVPTTEESTFWVTANPYGSSFDHLKYLVQYPYGCIEQTTSTTRPLLYVGNLLYNVDPALVSAESIEKRLESGISRILSMQTPSGGFGYWPGDTHPNYWGTAYATHLLLDAKKKGYDIPQDRLDDAIDFIDQELSTRADRNDAIHGYGYEFGEAYLHYVLAVSGKGRAARIQEMIDGYANNKDPEIDERVYLLKAALWLTGDHRYERDLKNPDVTPLRKERRNSWAYWSDLRKRGFELAIFQDLFGRDAAGEPLVRLVADGLTGESRYYTTQELVWGVTGLGRWIEGAAKDIPTPSLLVGGKALTAQPASPGSKAQDRTWSVARASEAGSVLLKLAGRPSGNVTLVLSSMGLSSIDPPTWGGSQVAVERDFVDAEGNEIDVTGGGLSLGDMVYVRIRLTSKRSSDTPNLALVDRLPAGWEIENPRLGRGTLPDWAEEENAWTADYLNVRDDRVEVFGTLPAGATREVIYAVRATTSGTFSGGSVEVEAMYDPDIWARSPGSRVVVQGPWADFYL